MNKCEEMGKTSIKEFYEKLREEILSCKVDLVAEIKCPDEQFRNRPLLDIATVLVILDNVSKEMNENKIAERKIEYALASVSTGKVFPQVFMTGEEAEKIKSYRPDPNHWKVVTREVSYSEWK